MGLNGKMMRHMLEENCMPNFLKVSARHSGMEKRVMALYGFTFPLNKYILLA